MPLRVNIVLIVFLLALITLGHDAYAQSLDSITHHYDSLAKIKLQQLDSSNNKIDNKVDSIQSRFNNILNPDFNKLTTKFRRKKFEVSDTLVATRHLDSMKLGLNHKIDSLERIGQPTDIYARKLDSITNITPQKYIDLANNKIQSLESKVTKPLNEIPGNLKTNLPNANFPNANLPDVPNVNLPNTDLNLDNPLSSIEKPSIDNPNIKNPLTNIQNPVSDQLGDVNQITDKVQSYQGDVKNVANGNLDAANVEQNLQSKVAQLDEVKDLHKQTGEMGKVDEMINANNPDVLKEKAQEVVMKQAVDHFAGKQEALKGAMDKLTKLKQKYNDVPSIKDLPKRAPNPMKGKPFIERIVPGVTLQIQNSNVFMIDFNPVISYRFTGRINAGFGWNERFAFSKWNKLSSDDRIYGPRVFGSFSFKKGFQAKAEIEKMNAFVPNSLAASDRSRAWVWSAFVGMKKDYKFIGKVRGNVQMLYNLWDDHDNSPYFDRFVVRMGFEFPMKKVGKQAEKAGK